MDGHRPAQPAEETALAEYRRLRSIAVLRRKHLMGIQTRRCPQVEDDAFEASNLLAWRAREAAITARRKALGHMPAERI